MSTVHAQPNYQMEVNLPPPPGYPTEWTADTRTTMPRGTFESRRQDLLAHIRQNPAPNNTKMIYYELARWAAGDQPHLGVFHAAMDFIDARKDCSDFVLHGVLRLLYQGESLVLSPESGSRQRDNLFERGRETVLNFKYWPDEACLEQDGADSLCTWTENHHILFASAAYLAGQMMPDEVFANSGHSGRQKMTINRPRILRWLDLRFHTGFSEWLSHVYYDEDLTALLSLIDFCGDEEIVRKATMVVDLLLLDMALNSFRGVFGATHGRAYENSKKWAGNEGTADIEKLLFGMGQYSSFDCMSAINFALSRNYRMPPVIAAIAGDGQRPAMENKQRMGIKIDEAETWGLSTEAVSGELQKRSGLDPNLYDDGMTFLTLEAYLHPRTAELTLGMFDAFNWWENEFFSGIQSYRKLLHVLRRLRLVKPLASVMEWDLCRNTREEVNIMTYRTPDTMLSCAQDYRPGFGGDQQHIWQATLGPDAVCFTTHPAKLEGVTPNYWAGSGQLPRAAQAGNVVICIYNLHSKPALYVPTKLFYTHAWLPKDQFDEVIESNRWIFARKGDGYLALRSQRPYYWKDAATHRQKDTRVRVKRDDVDYAEDVNREIVAPGRSNIWICELGRQATHGDFGAFVERIGTAALLYDGLDVRYESPSSGLLSFGWELPFTQNGKALRLHDYARYDNPFVRAEFAADKITVALGDELLALNWQTGERSTV